MKKLLATAAVLSFLMTYMVGSVVRAQTTASPTPTPRPASTGTTMPQGAPNTGFGY